MRIIPVKQGTQEWLMARLGIPTASRFDSILTPKTRKPSAQASKYLCELLAERLTGVPVNMMSTDFMQRGSALEHEAVSAYELERDLDTHEVGFIVTDDGRYGCSPDRLVGDDGLLEVKCVAIQNHIAALLGYDDEGFQSQCQGQLLVSGRQWVDRIYWNPVLPRHLVHVERDEEYIADLEPAVEAFCVRLWEAQRELEAMLGETAVKAMRTGQGQGRPEGMDARPLLGLH